MRRDVSPELQADIDRWTETARQLQFHEMGQLDKLKLLVGGTRSHAKDHQVDGHGTEIHKIIDMCSHLLGENIWIHSHASLTSVPSPSSQVPLWAYLLWENYSAEFQNRILFPLLTILFVMKEGMHFQSAMAVMSYFFVKPDGYTHTKYDEYEKTAGGARNTRVGAQLFEKK